MEPILRAARIHSWFTPGEGVHKVAATSYGALVLFTFLLVVCLTLPPVDGPVVADFAPSDGYAGHWGVDLAARPGSEVRAPDSGTVTFAGRVAGMRSVTIRLADELRVSLSYLSSIEVEVGERVPAGMIVGRSGLAHGEPAVHLSTRIGGTYVDPMAYLRCRSGTIRLLGDR